MTSLAEYKVPLVPEKIFPHSSDLQFGDYCSSSYSCQFLPGGGREDNTTCKHLGLTGDAPLDLTDDCSLALVWKNNERMKEFVLVESKELECMEDPGSASEAARAGHFTLEQCLNLFTKPEVLAPEEAW